MKKLLLILSVLLATIAPAQVVVQGNLKTILGTPQVGDAFLRVRLRNYNGRVPRVIGGGVVAGTVQDIRPDASGAISTTLYGNDQLDPQLTYYTFEYWQKGAMQASANFELCHTTDSLCPATQPFDFTSALPLLSIPNQTLPVVQVNNLRSSGNTNVIATSAGTLTSGDCVSLDAYGNYVDSGAPCSLPGTLVASSFSGSDILAKAVAASVSAGCASYSCTVEIGAGTYNNVTTTFAYPIANPGNFKLVIDAGAVINYTGTGCAIDASAVAPSNANNIQIYNFGHIVGTSAGKCGIRLGALNHFYVYPGDISGFTNSVSHPADVGWGSAILNNGANSGTISFGNLRGNRVGYYGANKLYGGGIGTGAAIGVTLEKSLHIQANTEWGVVLDGGNSGALDGSSLPLFNNTIEAIIEGNATATQWNCTVTGITRTAGNNVVVCAGAVAAKVGDAFHLNGVSTAFVPAGAKFYVNSVISSTSFTFGYNVADASVGAGGSAKQMIGGLNGTYCDNLTLNAYFELNGPDQDVSLGDTNFLCAGANVSSSFESSGTTDHAIEAFDGVNIHDSHVQPTYRKFVQIPSGYGNSVRLDNNQGMNDPLSEVESLAGSNAPGLYWRDKTGNFQHFPQIHSAQEVPASPSQSNTMTFCGWDGAARQCASIGAAANGIMQIGFVGDALIGLYVTGTLVSTSGVTTNQVNANALSLNSNLIKRLGMYTASLTPAATAANTCAQQTFTVTGVTASASNSATILTWQVTSNVATINLSGAPPANFVVGATVTNAGTATNTIPPINVDGSFVIQSVGASSFTINYTRSDTTLQTPNPGPATATAGGSGNSDALVSVTPPSLVDHVGISGGYVSAKDTVKVMFCGDSTGGTAASGTYKFVVLQ